VRPRVRRARRGIVGIEAAIVLIAFVLVASALAFVVLNMGMFTTQKTKEVIARAYEESTRAIDIAGNVVAKTATGGSGLDLVAIPIKLTAGSRAVDLNKTAVAITVILPDGRAQHTDNGYKFDPLQTFKKVTDFGTDVSLTNDLDATFVYARTDEDTTNKGDNLLEPGEIVLLVFKVPSGTGPYSRIIVEIKPPQGATVTVERVVPPKIDSTYVDLDVG